MASLVYTRPQPQLGRLVHVAATAAKTTYSDIANAVLLDTAGGTLGNMTAYTHLAALPLATVTATQLMLLAFDGTNAWLVATAVMAAQTVAVTTAISPTVLAHLDGSPISESNPLYLPNGIKLYVGIGVALAAGIVFNAQAEDF